MQLTGLKASRKMVQLFFGEEPAEGWWSWGLGGGCRGWRGALSLALNTLWVMETSLHPAACCSLATFLLAPFSCAGSLSPPWLMEPLTSCLAHKGHVATFPSLSIGI